MVAGKGLMIMTVEDIRAIGPCYDPVTGEDSDGNLVHAGGFCGDDWQGTALDVLRAQGVPDQDKLWVVLHDGWMPRAVCERFARWCALQVIQHWDAPEVVRRFLETGEDAMAAESAARAAESAAMAAARAARAAESAAMAAMAAESAARAAESAAMAAVRAARAAARAAESAAASAAARAAQVEQLIKLLEACDE